MRRLMHSPQQLLPPKAFRNRALKVAAVLAVALTGALVVGACSPKSPAEQVAEQRALYTAELTNFVLMTEPTMDDSLDGAMGEDGMDGTETSTDMAPDMDGAVDEAAADAAAMPVVSVEQKILLDILVQNKGSESLAGVTVDITQVDSNKAEKAVWKAFLELPSLAHGSTEQVTHVLEDPDYVEGDGFHVEVRSPIPEAERGDYVEFSNAGQ